MFEDNGTSTYYYPFFVVKEGEEMNFLDRGNTFMAIYEETENYKNLREEDQKFFKSLFVLLLIFGDLTMSNKELAERIKKEEEKEGIKTEKPQSISTVEKRISRLKKAKLIKGYEEREFINGRWTTIRRHLFLDPVLFGFATIEEQEIRIQTARLQACNKEINALHPELATLCIPKEPEEPPPKYKVEVKFG